MGWGRGKDRKEGVIMERGKDWNEMGGEEGGGKEGIKMGFWINH